MDMPRASPRNFEVLVADDDPDVRELLGEFFRGRQLTVAAAHDGRAAINALERSSGRYRLVLTDIGMPGADGFAVLRAAREACPDAYVVIMTGFASLDTAIEAVRLGANDYLTKPFSLGQIDVIVDRAFALASMDRRRQPIGTQVPSHASGDIQNRLAAIEKHLASIDRTLEHLIKSVSANR